MTTGQGKNDTIEHFDGDNVSSELQQNIAEALLMDVDRREESRREWTRLASTLGLDTRRRRVAYILRWAACVAVVALASYFAWHNVTGGTDVVVYEAMPGEANVTITSVERPAAAGGERPAATAEAKAATEWKTVSVPATKDYRLTLPYGSTVWLNAGAELSYPVTFGRRREVRLKGEGYFEVAHDAAHPFVVTTGKVATRVVGTEFNVDATGDTPRITLVSGRVDVDDINGVTLASLLPSESATVTGDSVVKTVVDVDDIVCWRDGIELFDDDRLEDILVSIGSWYNVSVVCRDMPLLDSRLHFVYDRRSSVEEALTMLSRIAKIKVNVEKNTIFVD